MDQARRALPLLPTAALPPRPGALRGPSVRPAFHRRRKGRRTEERLYRYGHCRPFHLDTPASAVGGVGSGGDDGSCRGKRPCPPATSRKRHRAKAVAARAAVLAGAAICPGVWLLGLPIFLQAGLPGWSAGTDLSFPPGVLVSGPGRCAPLRGAPPRPDGAMMILGINAYHGDVSAALLRDGELIAAVEEERFRRIKHWAGFPREAIRTCLELAKITAE